MKKDSSNNSNVRRESAGTASEISPRPPQRIAIIGAGPLGLEAAHYALRSGYAVRLFEASPEVAPNIRTWEHLSLFSPWGNLRTPLGEEVVAEYLGKSAKIPRSSLYPTGEELMRWYFEPLAKALPPKTLWLDHKVIGVARAYMLPDEMTDQPSARSGHPFRILTRNAATGEERAWSAEYVLDCTSGGRVPAWIGCGGLPAIGELGCTHRIHRYTPDIGNKERGAFALKKTLLIGDGTSAATSAVLLGELAESQPGSQFYWAVKSDRDLPCALDPGAPQSSRRSLMLSKANLLVKSAKSYLVYSKRTQVEEIRYNIEAGKFYVTLQVDRVTKRYQFDNVIANVGSRRESPYMRNIMQDEPGYFEIGAVDCGSSENAMRYGHGEVQAVFRKIASSAALDGQPLCSPE